MKSRTGLIAALDIGTTKVCCFIARLSGNEETMPQVTGIGHQIAHGLKAGVIIDMEEAEAAILNTVHAAEQMAGETVRHAIINISGGKLLSRSFSVASPVTGHEITQDDLTRAFKQGCAAHPAPEQRTLHTIPVSYSIDGSRGIRDPRGMYGEQLGINMHLISAPNGIARNLRTCVERCHLDVVEVVATPYASGLACLVEDEMDLGSVCIDMGGGTTSISVFADGKIVYCSTLPVGGAHVTNDIARGLSTTLAHAERMKTLYGSAIPSINDERDYVDVPLIGEEKHTQPNHVPKSVLNSIIRPRLEEILEMVRDNLEQSGFDRISGQRAVLTGGGSQMQGIRDLAAMILDKQIRIGKPTRIGGLAEATGGPAFSACSGLLIHSLKQKAEVPVRERGFLEESSGLMGRVGLWLRESF